MQIQGSTSQRPSTLVLALGACVALALLLPAAGRAATIVVDTGGDTAEDECTLRHAVLSVNGGADSHGCEAAALPYGANDTIEVPAAVGPTVELAGPSVTLEPPADLAIKGPGAAALDIQGGASFGVFEVFASPAVTVTISGLTISGGHDVSSTVAEGGGINVRSESELVLDRVVVTENSTAVNASSGSPNSMGGGIRSVGPVTLRRTTVSDNEATDTANGAGVFAVATGGGVWVDDDLVVEASTIADNTSSASVLTGTGAAADGGGVQVGSGSSSVEVIRSTIVGNAAIGTTSSFGGGVYANVSGPTSYESTTIAGNQAGQGANVEAQSAATFENTIVARPLGGANCDDQGAGNFTSNGYNLEEGASTCGFGSGPGDEPTVPSAGLAPALAGNGGPTPTLALLPGSPAVDGGHATLGESQDQRDFARPVDFPGVANASGGDGTDVGAFELQQACAGQATPEAACASGGGKTPPPPPPAPPTAPGVVKLLTRQVSPVKGKLPLKLFCQPTGATCGGSLKILTAHRLALSPGAPKKRQQLGSASFTIGSGRTKLVRVPITAAARKLLAEPGKVAAKATLVTRGSEEKRVAHGALTIVP